MALFTRPSRGSAEATARYARCLDGTHLWLDVESADPVRLVGDGVDLAVGELTRLPDDVTDLALVAGRRQTPVAWGGEPAPAGPTRDPGPWQVITDDGVVRLHRAEVPHAPEVTAIAVVAGGVAVSVSPAPTLVELRQGGQQIGERPVTDGTLLLTTFPEVTPGNTARFDLRRAAHVLVRPNASVALPPLPEPDVELRWLKDGVLAVHRRGARA